MVREGGREGGREGKERTLNSSPTLLKVELSAARKRFLPVQDKAQSLEGTHVLLLPVSKMT